MNKGGIIGMAVLLITLLVGVIIWQHVKLSASAQAATAEEARNTELQKKVESLEQEVTTLKETADYYFQQGVDQQSAGNLQVAKTAFEAVVVKFPTSSLVGSARQRLAAVNEAIAKAEAEKAAEMQRQQEEQARLDAVRGEEIEYKLFYAKAESNGLPVFKRFRFRANINHGLTLCQDTPVPPCTDGLFGKPAFDHPEQYEPKSARKGGSGDVGAILWAQRGGWVGFRNQDGEARRAREAPCRSL